MGRLGYTFCSLAPHKVFFLGEGDEWNLDLSNIVGDRELTMDGVGVDSKPKKHKGWDNCIH